ncbi:hypothetical protein CJU90_3012 [Yarrowia sp. C11]|nr:hypothetical protein CKK34_4462 [Yarrowia sp. E02]KAG5369553.1 hypothetical protein CJU90_3012 [Yarrowia sp. C11]
MTRDQTPRLVPARDSGLSFNSNVSKKRTYSSSSLAPSVLNVAYNSPRHSSTEFRPSPEFRPGFSHPSTPPRHSSVPFRHPSTPSRQFGTQSPSRNCSFSSVNSLRSVASPSTGFSAYMTPPLPPLQSQFQNENSSEQPLTYGQLVALLWEEYGQDSYLEARSLYLAQFTESSRHKLDGYVETGRPMRLKKKRSLWSLLSRDE